MEHMLLTEKIIGAAFKVYNRMGFGFLESVYEKCLLIELSEAGFRAKSQQPIIIRYDDQIVGEFFADIVVEEKIILELKSASKLVAAHEVQLVNYLVATGIETGLLINFGPEKVQVKRKFRKLAPSHPVNPVILSKRES